MPSLHKEKFIKKINLTEDEVIVDVIHRHPLASLHKMLIGLALLIVPFFFLFYLLQQGILGVTLLVAIVVFAFFYILREYYIWHNNVVVATNKKIIDIDQKGFFNKTVSEVAMTKIVDISYQSKGVISAMLRTGTVEVKTSVPGLRILISRVKTPRLIVATLTELVEGAGGQIKKEPLTSEQKMENADDFLRHEELEEYENLSLKQLIADYVETYSKLKLKKLLADELDKANVLDEDDEEKDEDEFFKKNI